MLTVVLTGGMAAGKSTASAHLRQRGVWIIDADAIAGELLGAGGRLVRRVVAAFGESVLAEDGSINRPALAAQVFADGAARRRLEKLTHPPIREEIARQRDAARASGAKLVVQDIPLFVESGGRTSGAWGTVDVVLTVYAPEALRLSRAVQDRGMALAEAQARLDSQASESERQAGADIVLDGSGTPDQLAHQLDAWLETLS
ncbi:MAG: dephospho-CoA kinase [Bifidobacteriaceae bacterium]|jgi:dephospho-CoA kinase|nr:dephospho-CoA kinase [Bifidobacteriaceae bacterium]